MNIDKREAVYGAQISLVALRLLGGRAVQGAKETARRGLKPAGWLLGRTGLRLDTDAMADPLAVQQRTVEQVLDDLGPELQRERQYDLIDHMALRWLKAARRRDVREPITEQIQDTAFMLLEHEVDPTTVEVAVAKLHDWADKAALLPEGGDTVAGRPLRMVPPGSLE